LVLGEVLRDKVQTIKGENAHPRTDAARLVL